ncbi:MAG: ABC transporter substrate-binding protein [Bacillota bacterium]
MKKFLGIIAVAMIMVLILVLAACGKKTDEGTNTSDVEKQPNKIMKIGSLQPFSGPLAQMGEAVHRDMEAYVAVINEEGGLKVGDDTYTIELYKGDDNGTPEGAAQAGRDLVENKGVIALTGHWTYGGPVLADYLTPKKIFFMLTKATNYDPARMPYYAFNTDDSQIIGPHIKSALTYLKDVKVMAFTTADVAWPTMQMGIDPVLEYLHEQGIQTVTEQYAATTMDFTTHLEILKNKNVDTIYSWGAKSQEANMLKVINESKLGIRFIGAAENLDTKEFIEMTGKEAAQGSLHGYTPPWEFKETKIAPETLDLAMKIKAKYEEMFNEPHAYTGSFGYGTGTMQLLFLAMQKAGTIDPDEVMKAMEGGTFDLFWGTQTLGGKQTHGRDVFGGMPGGLGVIEGDGVKFVAESPLRGQDIP